MIDIKIKRLNSNAITPTQANPNDAGWDLYANIPGYLCIYPHCTEKIPTGFAWAIPNGYFGGVYARSGLASKQGLRPANCVGVIDSGYRGEVIVALHNDTDDVKKICYGDRIAQMIVQPYANAELTEVDELDDTDRGSGGFGSSGI